MRRVPWTLLVLLLVGPVASCKVGIDAETREALDSNVERIVGATDGIVAAIDTQREKLSEDVLQHLGVVAGDLRIFTDQLHNSVAIADNSVRDFQKGMTNGLLVGTDRLAGHAERLLQGLNGDARGLVRELAETVAKERELAMHQLNDFVRQTIGPTIVLLERSGQKLVVQVATEAHVLTVRVVSGVVAALAVLGLGLSARRVRRRGRDGVVVVLLGGLGGLALAGFATATVLARPAARIGAPEVELPDGDALCAKMSEVGRAFRAARAGGERPARGAVPPEVIELRRLAIQCATYDRSGQMVDVAKDYLRDAGAVLGEKSRCRTDQDCGGGGKRCHARSGECVDDLCERPVDCPSGFQCGHQNRCVPIDEAQCAAAADCRPEDACDLVQSGRCVSMADLAARPRPCRVAGVSGPCADGVLRAVNRVTSCESTNLRAEETCDGVDNDCDGSVDNGVRLAPTCIAPGAAGDCQTGTPRCADGRETCEAGAKSAEVCDNRDNDCDGRVDNRPSDCRGASQRCRQGQCLACGAEGQPCCEGTRSCRNDLRCDADTCVPASAGIPQTPCASASPATGTKDGKPPSMCGPDALVCGVSCLGSYCSEAKVHCIDGVLPREVARRVRPRWTEDRFWQNEPEGRKTASGFLQGLQCIGTARRARWRIECTSLKAAFAENVGLRPVKETCQWIEGAQESKPFVHCAPGKFAAGVRCTGEYCDAIGLWCCEPERVR